jgi:hypothetical protein
MGRATTIPDQFDQLANIEERIRRLEQLLPEDPHVVGATGEPGFTGSWANYDASRKVSFYRHGGRTYLFGVAKWALPGPRSSRCQSGTGRPSTVATSRSCSPEAAPRSSRR